MPKEASAKRNTSKTTKRGKDAAPGKAKRRTKSKKDPNAPKRGLSAYMFFANETRDLVKKENPSAGFGEIGKLLGEKWKELSEDDRQKFKDMAEKDKERYESQKAAYDKKPTSNEVSDEEEEDEDDDDA